MDEIDRRRFIRVTGASIVALPALLAACGAATITTSSSGGGGGSTEETVAQLEKKARQEGGRLVYYATESDSSEPLAAAFEKVYPWASVDVDTSAGGSGIVAKVLTEANAGHPSSDVIEVSGPVRPTVLVQSKVVVPFSVPNDGKIQPSLRDPSGYRHPEFQDVLAFVYNTNLMDSPPPTNLLDLGDAKWKGKIAFDQPSNLGVAADILASHRKAWGDSKWRKWLGQLKSNDIFLTSDAGAAYQAVLSGERPLGLDDWADVHTQPAGTPVAAAFFDGIPPYPSNLFLTKGAAHPNTAKLFINYILSDAGQKVMATTGRTPTTDIASDISLKAILGSKFSIESSAEIAGYVSDPQSYLNIYNEYWPS